jgi:dihydrofolate reductase
MIKMIVAIDRSNAIGWKDGRLPWRLPADMKRFKELTTGHTVVMGRTTYQSLGRPNGLPNRRNVVLTRRPYSEVRGQFGDVEIISSLDWVTQHAEAIRRTTDGTDQQPNDIWIIGGASVYEEALAKDIVDEMYVTLVEDDSGADVRLTTDLAAWKLFVLRNDWVCAVEDSQLDLDFHTTYLRFTRIR